MSNDDTTTATPEFVKGTWQHDLHESSTLLDRAGKAKHRASNLLWTGATTGINEWLPNSSDDVNGEALYADVLAALGTPRKGDASKIKTVALAVRNNGLVLATYPNLSKAYAEATRLTKTVKAEADEDDAAEKAIESIEAPKTTGSIEGAAALLLSKGLDGAVVAILDALGANNEAAHRAFMRAVSTEVAARVQANKPKPAPKVAGPKAGAKQATGKAAPKATIKDGAAKAKPTPVSKSKGDPNRKALPAKAKPAQNQTVADKGEPVDAPVHVGEDADAPVTAETTTPVKKAVRRAVVKR
jgi:hypothetical protein